MPYLLVGLALSGATSGQQYIHQLLERVAETHQPEVKVKENHIFEQRVNVGTLSIVGTLIHE